MPFAEGPLEQDGDDSTLTMREAVTAILVAAVAADGTLVEQEAERLNALLPSMRLFRQTSAAHLQRLTETALDIIGSTGPDALLPACAEVIPESLRAPLFALAVELVIVDGDVSANRDAIRGLAEVRSGYRRRDRGEHHRGAADQEPRVMLGGTWPRCC